MTPHDPAPSTSAAVALRGTRAITPVTLLAAAAMLIVSGIVLMSDGPILAIGNATLTGS